MLCGHSYIGWGSFQKGLWIRALINTRKKTSNIEILIVSIMATAKKAAPKAAAKKAAPKAAAKKAPAKKK